MSKVVLLLVAVVVCAALGASAARVRIASGSASACATGNVMMELSAKLPSHNRWSGDPCTDNSQCASGKCACVDGGRHCVVDKDCAADGEWPATHAGELATLPCVNGTVGTRVRKCEADGEWSEENRTCKDPVCQREEEWPETRVGETATLSCPRGSGSRTRKCLAGEASTGVWGSPVSSCSGPECTATGIWPTTPAGVHAELGCAEGFIGYQSRFCTPAGTWQEDINNVCRPAGCPADDEWPATELGVFVSLPCADEGMKGSRRRFCQQDAQWADVENSCYFVCAAVGVWPETHAGNFASLDCGEGFTGDKKRECTWDGTWAPNTEIQDNCQAVAPGCPADAGWPHTDVATMASLPCQGGAEGNMERYCSDMGMWEDVYDGDCVFH